MPRIKALIDKLNIQYEHKATPAELLSTIQLLQTEIAGGWKETEMLGSTNVSVLIPNVHSIKYPAVTEANTEGEKVYFELPAVEGSEEEMAELLLENEKFQTELSAKLAQKEVERKSEKEEIAKAVDLEDLENGAINEIPTFAQYKKKEWTPTANLASQVDDETDALKYLKAAISELDKQLFLRELFRDDADMYERSIKTIDNFIDYADAEFWIRRELKTKLGWFADNPTVDHFDRLVKRRFA